MAWVELFQGKASIYALDETSKEWVDRGSSGQLFLMQNTQYTTDIRIRWVKFSVERFWLLVAGGKLKPKGERAWVLKAHESISNQQEILAIRFSSVQLSREFEIQFHQLFPQQNAQAQAQQHIAMGQNYAQPVYPQPQAIPQPQSYYNAPYQANNVNNGYGMQQAMVRQSMPAMDGPAIYNHYSNQQPRQSYDAQNPILYGSAQPINPINSPPSSWECAVCTYSNEPTRTACIMCGLAQHKEQPMLPTSPVMYPAAHPVAAPLSFPDTSLSLMQAHSSSSQSHMVSSFEQNQLNPSVVYSPHVRRHSNSWICAMCTLHNDNSVQTCAACNSARKDAPETDAIKAKAYIGIQPMHINEGGSASVQEFQQSASDIACYNDSPSHVFSTLRSVAKKLMKDDVRYRTLDTTNERVMERLMGFEGVLDFLMLLGFRADDAGLKLVCAQKPSPQTVKNAIQVLNSYGSRMDFGRRNMQMTKKDEDDCLSSATPCGPGDEAAADEDGDTLTMQQIIMWSTHENMRDTDSMDTLILTHKQFVTSLQLMKKLRQRFMVHIPQNIRNDTDKTREFRQNVERRIQLKVTKSLRGWMRTYWDDDFDNNPQLHQELQEWLQEMDSMKSEACSWIAPLSAVVRKEYERYKVNSPTLQKKLQSERNRVLDPDTGVPKFLEHVEIKKGYKIPTAEELADAITLMDYRIFSCIGARECMGQAWRKKKKQSPNVLAMIDQFNSLSVFVQMQVLKEKNVRERGKSLKKLIKMGQRLRELQNYNALSAVKAALNSSAIHRLKAAWSRVPEKQMNQLAAFKEMFVSSKNFHNFRQLFRSTSPPAIPYFGLFLQDLTFIDEGNKKYQKIDDFKQHGDMVNFKKCIRCVDRITNINLYQTRPYVAGKDLKEQPFLQKILYQEFHQMRNYSENQIWDMSTQVKKADEGK